MLHKLKDFLSKKKQADPLTYHSTYLRRLAPYGLALTLISLPAHAQQCTMFDVWGNSGICNRFPSHVEAEQYYDACFNTVDQFMPKLDSCLNELAELKNNQDKEPTPAPSNSPSAKCNRVGDFKDGSGGYLWKAIPDPKASCASVSVVIFPKELLGTLGASIDILDSKGNKIGSAKPKEIGPVMNDGRSVYCTNKRFSGNIFVDYTSNSIKQCREVYEASQRED